MSPIPDMDKARNEILKLLNYYAIFRHPLTLDEILKYIQIEMRREEVEATIKGLIANGSVFELGNYYSVVNDPEFVSKRINGEKKAASLIGKAFRCGKLIALFPFV